MFLLELAILIISLLAGAYSLRSWWMASGKPAETAPDGSLMLRFSRNTFWLGFLSLTLGAGLIFAAVFLGRDIETGISLFLMGAAIATGGAWLMSEYFNNRLIVNNRYILQKKWLRQDTIIDWARLEKVKFSAKSGNFILIGLKGEKIRVSRLMRGFNDFKVILDSQIPDARIDKDSMQEYQKMQQMEKELLDELRRIGKEDTTNNRSAK